MKVQELLLRELQLPKGKVLRLLEPFLFQRLSPDIFRPRTFSPDIFFPDSKKLSFSISIRFIPTHPGTFVLFLVVQPFKHHFLQIVYVASPVSPIT